MRYSCFSRKRLRNQSLSVQYLNIKILIIMAWCICKSVSLSLYIYICIYPCIFWILLYMGVGSFWCALRRQTPLPSLCNPPGWYFKSPQEVHISPLLSIYMQIWRGWRRGGRQDGPHCCLLLCCSCEFCNSWGTGPGRMEM